MQKQNLCQGDFMPKNRQHYRKIKYPDKVTKQKRLVFVRIFLFSSVGSRNAYFPTAPFSYHLCASINAPTTIKHTPIIFLFEIFSFKVIYDNIIVHIYVIEVRGNTTE